MEWVHVAVVGAIVLLMEFIWQMCQRTERYIYPYNVGAAFNIIELEEFHQQVKFGRKLVLLDDFVLDVSKFLDEHPGGRFSLEHNIGRDVSKFFHGGYALENLPGFEMKVHTHSRDARRVVNSLIIGRLEAPAKRKLLLVEKSQRDANETGTIKTILFDGVINKDIPCSLLDIRYIGRHYLVKSTSHRQSRGATTEKGHFDISLPGIKRHYTEAFCMRPNVHDSILELA